MGVALLIGGYLYFSKALPGIEALGDYKPPTVTVVYDQNGELMGEIYEKRRYVVPLEQMPQHLKDAFLAAEDANFWEYQNYLQFHTDGEAKATSSRFWKNQKKMQASLRKTESYQHDAKVARKALASGHSCGAYLLTSPLSCVVWGRELALVSCLRWKETKDCLRCGPRQALRLGAAGGEGCRGHRTPPSC